MNDPPTPPSNHEWRPAISDNVKNSPVESSSGKGIITSNPNSDIDEINNNNRVRTTITGTDDHPTEKGVTTNETKFTWEHPYFKKDEKKDGDAKEAKKDGDAKEEKKLE